MDHLHSYWRMPYVEAPKREQKGKNPFVKIPLAKDDKAVYLLWRGEYTYLVLNKFPYNPGHLLALPYREIATLSKMNPIERTAMMDTIILAQDILTQALEPNGFNIGCNIGCAAGAGIPHHLHCHIVPRWEGDTNFMPVIGKTRVLAESLEAMWERLRSFTPPKPL